MRTQSYQKQALTSKFYFIIGLFALIIFLQLQTVSAEFNKDNSSSWKEDISKFIALSDSDKNAGWAKLDLQKRKEVIQLYAKSKKRDIKFSGDFDSSDLKWLGKTLTNGKAIIDFEKLSENVIEIGYDKTKKEFFYIFKGKNGNTKFSFDEGSINEKGEHVIKGRKTNAEVFYKQGEVNYRNGKYLISGGASVRFVTSKGALVFSENKETSDFITTGPTEIEMKADGSFVHKKAMVSITKVSVESTGMLAGIGLGSEGKITVGDKPSLDFLSGDEEISLYVGRKPPTTDNSYQYVDLDSKQIITDAKNAYSVARLLDNFKEIQGSGNRAYIANGKSLISFFEKKVNMEANGKGEFEVEKIGLIGEITPEKGWYTWRKNSISKSVDFFNSKERFLQTIAETKTGWTGGKGKVSTSSTSLEYSKEFQKEYFRPNKEGMKAEDIEKERIAGIMKDKNTIIKLTFPQNHPIPGQLVAAEMLSSFELGSAVTKIKTEKEGMGSLGAALYNDPMLRSQASYGMVVSKNFNSKQQVSSGLSSEEIAKLPEVNRFLYSLATTYGGDVGNLLRNSEGVSSIEYRSSGIYVNGKKFEGVSANVADAMKATMSANLFYYVPGKGITQPDLIKYSDEIEKQYRFGSSFKEDPFKDRTFGPEPTGRRLLFRYVPGSRIEAMKEGMAAAKKAPFKYNAYKSAGLLP